MLSRAGAACCKPASARLVLCRQAPGPAPLRLVLAPAALCILHVTARVPAGRAAILSPRWQWCSVSFSRLCDWTWQHGGRCLMSTSAALAHQAAAALGRPTMVRHVEPPRTSGRLPNVYHRAPSMQELRQMTQFEALPPVEAVALAGPASHRCGARSPLHVLLAQAAWPAALAEVCLASIMCTFTAGMCARTTRCGASCTKACLRLVRRRPAPRVALERCTDGFAHPATASDAPVYHPAAIAHASLPCPGGDGLETRGAARRPAASWSPSVPPLPGPAHAGRVRGALGLYERSAAKKIGIPNGRWGSLGGSQPRSAAGGGSAWACPGRGDSGPQPPGSGKAATSSFGLCFSRLTPFRTCTAAHATARVGHSDLLHAYHHLHRAACAGPSDFVVDSDVAAAAAAHNAAAVLAFNASKGQAAPAAGAVTGGAAAAAAGASRPQCPSGGDTGQPAAAGGSQVAADAAAAGPTPAGKSRHARRRLRKKQERVAATAAATPAGQLQPSPVGGVSEEHKLRKARALSSLGEATAAWLWAACNAPCVAGLQFTPRAGRHSMPPCTTRCARPPCRPALHLLLLGLCPGGGGTGAGGSGLPPEPAGRGGALPPAAGAAAAVLGL